MTEGWNRVNGTKQNRITIHLVQKARSQQVTAKQRLEQSLRRQWRILACGSLDFAHHRGAVYKEDAPQLTGFFEPLRPERLHDKSDVSQKLCGLLDRATCFRGYG